MSLAASCILSLAANFLTILTLQELFQALSQSPGPMGQQGQQRLPPGGVRRGAGVFQLLQHGGKLHLRERVGVQKIPELFHRLFQAVFPVLSQHLCQQAVGRILFLSPLLQHLGKAVLGHLV